MRRSYQRSDANAKKSQPARNTLVALRLPKWMILRRVFITPRPVAPAIALREPGLLARVGLGS